MHEKSNTATCGYYITASPHNSINSILFMCTCTAQVAIMHIGTCLITQCLYHSGIVILAIVPNNHSACENKSYDIIIH